MVKLIEIKFITTFLNMLIEKKIEKILKSIKKNIKLNSIISEQLDSMQFLNLVIQLEQNFQVKIPESKIKVNNFKNVKKIKSLVNEKKNRIKIIAEIGPNHNGDINLAKKMLKSLSKTNVDIVKFQLGDPYKIFSKDALIANYQKKTKFKDPILLSKKNQLSRKAHIELKKMCVKLRLTYSCTAFDLDSLIFLDKTLNIPFFKIASGEIHSIDMLDYIAKSKKPVILSTGMASSNDVNKSLKILKKYKKKNIVLLHCVSSYPTKLKDMNLKRIDFLKKRFNLQVGLSDHSVSFTPALVAITKGAPIIEKHVTYSKKLKGPDHQASLEIKDLKIFIDYIRETEILCN